MATAAWSTRPTRSPWPAPTRGPRAAGSPTRCPTCPPAARRTRRPVSSRARLPGRRPSRGATTRTRSSRAARASGWRTLPARRARTSCSTTPLSHGSGSTWPTPSKIPWQAYLGTGHPLLSGDGRVLATIVGDDSGRHDALCGTSTAAANQAKYGDSAPRRGRVRRAVSCSPWRRPSTGWPRATCRRLSRSSRACASARTAAWPSPAAPARAQAVELLAELPLIILIANVPHPVDPSPAYTCGLLRVHAWRSAPTTPGQTRAGTPPPRRTAPTSTPPTTWPQGGCDVMSTRNAVLDPANYAEGTVLDLAGPLADGAILLDEVVPARAPWSAVVQPRRHPHHRGRRRQPVRRLPALQRP